MRPSGIESMAANQENVVLGFAPAFQLFQDFQVADIENATTPAAYHFTLVSPATAPLLKLGVAFRAFEIRGCFRLALVH
jgi:hypothetical protein